MAQNIWEIIFICTKHIQTVFLSPIPKESSIITIYWSFTLWLYYLLCLWECGYMHTTAHMWRSEGNFWDLVIFHLSVPGSLSFLLLHCAPHDFQGDSPVSASYVTTECWDCRCMPRHPALHGFWRLWATVTFTGWATSPALVYAVLGIASSLKVTRTRGCVQAGDVHNVYTTLHMETSSTDAPATIPTSHTDKHLDWLI